MWKARRQNRPPLLGGAERRRGAIVTAVQQLGVRDIAAVGWSETIRADLPDGILPLDQRLMTGSCPGHVRIDGTCRLPELHLDWPEGYEKSQPARIGNAASKQLQLDVPGRGTQRSALGAGRGSGWSQFHFVHSKVMCWAGTKAAARRPTAWPSDSHRLGSRLLYAPLSFS
jgi:hypothetical protein